MPGVEPKPVPIAAGIAGSTESPGNLGALWANVARQASGSNALLRTALINSELAELTPSGATVDCPPRFAPVASKGVGAVATALCELVGRRIDVTIRVREAPAEPANAGAAPATNEAGEAAPAAADAQRSEAGRGGTPIERSRPFNANLAVADDLVKRAIELFNARVVDVQPRRR